MREVPPSDHFDGRRFFNPGVETDKTFREFLRFATSGARAAWPSMIGEEQTVPPPADVPPGEIVVTFIGQATMLIQVAGCNLLTDPFFSDRASPFAFAGPRRARPPAIRLEDLPPIRFVLLSHNHYDHMDLAALRALQHRFAPTIVTGLRNGAYLRGKGVGGAVELDWWESLEPAQDLRITYVPAQHWSSRTPFDRRRMLWGGHMIDTPAGRIYFAGDSGYGPHFRLIRDRLGAPEIALLPIGAYEPRWFMQAQHMNPEDAVEAHRDLGARLSIGMHFGTIQLTDEAIDAPAEALRRAMQARDLDGGAFVVPGFGRPIRHVPNRAGNG